MWLSTGMLFLRFCIGITLLLAGYLKMRAGADWFRQPIRDYALVRGLLLEALTYVIPPLEIILVNLQFA